MTTLRKVLPLILLCAALSGLPLAAQTQDCSFTYTFTGDGTYTVSNLSGVTPCVNWRLTLSVTGSLTTTATFYTSPDNSVFTAVPNTVCSATVQPPCILQGANPIVGTQGMMYVAAYGAFVRVVTSSSSGSGNGTIRGYGVKGASAQALPAGGGGGGSGTVTSVGFTGGIVTVNTPTTTPALIIAGTSGGIPYFTSASTWATSVVLGLNGVVLGGGAGGAPTVTVPDSTPTHALFATAGAPAFRAIVLSDLPALPGAVACPENPISMTATNTYTCTDNLGVATGKFLWCQDPNSTPVNAAVQVAWAGATINTFTWVAAATETVNCYGSLGGGSGGGGGGGGLVLLEQHTASSSASIDFTSAISSTYDTYEIELVNVLPASGSNNLYLEFSTDGGATFDTSAIYDFAYNYALANNTTGGDGHVNQAGFIVAGGALGNVNFGANGIVYLRGPLNATLQKSITWNIAYYHDAFNVIFQETAAGVYKNTTAVNAARFVLQTGNIASGTIRMYGRQK